MISYVASIFENAVYGNDGEHLRKQLRDMVRAGQSTPEEATTTSLLCALHYCGLADNIMRQRKDRERNDTLFDYLDLEKIWMEELKMYASMEGREKAA